MVKTSEWPALGGRSLGPPAPSHRRPPLHTSGWKLLVLRSAMTDGPLGLPKEPTVEPTSDPFQPIDAGHA
jgi:hypothetical protein